MKKKFKKTIHASYISTISNKMAENPFHQWNQSKKPSPRPLISNNSHFELSKLDKANSNESHERNEWRERDTDNTKRGAERKFSRQDSAKRCVSINQSSNEREFHAETRLPSRSVSTWKWIPPGRIAPSRCAWAGLSLCNSRLLNSKGWWRTKRGGMWVISCNLLPGREVSVSKT